MLRNCPRQPIEISRINVSNTLFWDSSINFRVHAEIPSGSLPEILSALPLRKTVGISQWMHKGFYCVIFSRIFHRNSSRVFLGILRSERVSRYSYRNAFRNTFKYCFRNTSRKFSKNLIEGFLQVFSLNSFIPQICYFFWKLFWYFPGISLDILLEIHLRVLPIFLQRFYWRFLQKFLQGLFPAWIQSKIIPGILSKKPLDTSLFWGIFSRISARGLFKSTSMVFFFRNSSSSARIFF